MKGKMKVQNFLEPMVMNYEEHDIPQIADNEVLVRVKAVGICGSDISYYFGHSPLDTPNGKGPLYLGHEFSGVVAEVGKLAADMDLFKEGDRVAINPVQQCNACPACMRGEFNECEHPAVIGVSANGAFAEYVKVKYTHVYRIPDEVSFEDGALAEPLACATYGVKRLDIEMGQTVVVFGTGTIGMMQIQIAKAAGAGKVIAIGIVDEQLEYALKNGATHVINSVDKNSKFYAADVPAKVREYNNGNLAPRAIVPTSAMPALQQALEVTGKSSTIVYFGLPSPEDRLQVPVLDAIQSDRTIKFSWLAPLVWDNVFNMIASGQVKLAPLITQRFQLENLKEAFEFMKDSKEFKIKGIVVID